MPRPSTWGRPGGTAAIGRPTLRLAIAFGAALLGLLALPAPPAAAHATLLFTTPAADGAVPTSPAELRLVFDKPVIVADSAIQVTDSTGQSVRLGRATSRGSTVTADVLATLADGEYVVDWTVSDAADGESMAGEYRFAVGRGVARLAESPATPTATRGWPITTALRWVMFTGLALALGGSVGARIAARRRPDPRAPVPTPWFLQGIALGVVATLGLALAFLGDGSLTTGIVRLGELDRLWSSTPGRVALAEPVAFATAGALFAVRRRALAASVLLAVPIAEGLRAHPHAAAGALGALVTTVHLAAAAVWVGALVHLIRAGRRWHRAGLPAAPAVSAYARLALWLFLAVVVTGSLAALMLTPPENLIHTLLDTAYGRWLLVKLGIVGVVAALALSARRHLSRPRGQAQPAVAVRYEAVGLVAVLAVSGLLTTLTPPARGEPALPFAPPSVGTVQYVGSRAGWIGIGGAASQGQLVVRLHTPSMGMGTPGSGNDPRYDLAGTVASPRGTQEHDLRFLACGTGCFVAPVAWQRGTNLVTLTTSADQWAGGTTTLRFWWPARSAPAMLRKVAATMRRVPTLALNEQVTSNTGDGLGDLRRIRMRGRAFLEQEPYASGIAPSVTVLDRREDQATIALAYPAEGIYARLTVDPAGRILRETLSDHHHLTTRTFTYP